MTKTLVKFVAVTSSGMWLTMEDSLAKAQAAADRYPATHVERWTYPELPDGTHGDPTKHCCN